MNRVRIILVAIMGLLVVGDASAVDDCLVYKMTPRVRLETPQWQKSVVQPLKPMDFLHGNVIATLIDNYDITADVTPIEDGFCVALKAVDATIGYNDFLVQIDRRHRPGTCAYDAILSHEDEHIRAYLSIADDMAGDIYTAVQTAAMSVMPVFVHDELAIESAIDELNRRLQSHPDVMLINRQIRGAEEIKNRAVDAHDDGSRLKVCGDF